MKHSQHPNGNHTRSVHLKNVSQKPKMPMGTDTKAIHAGSSPDPATLMLHTPLHQGTTFVFPDAESAAAAFAGENDLYIYTRVGNPTNKVLERRVAALEDGPDAVATASGMAAISSAVLTLLGQGDHLVSSCPIYSCTFDLFAFRLGKLGIETTMVYGTDVADFERALRPNTKAIFIETPGNPILNIIDIRAITEMARRHGVVTVFDNSFATPIGQLPLTMGADIVVHSATKYLCGHGDAVGGVVVGSEEYLHRLRKEVLEEYGGIMSPFNAWLILRGIETLPLRYARHSSNALDVAQYLENHPLVESVHYPGLASHPQHNLARRQMRQFGGMLSFEVKGGVAAGRCLMNALRLCSLAVSLGDTKTLVNHPASMTHSKVPRENRLQAGITDGLVRISVGLENPEDIIADLEQALAKCKVHSSASARRINPIL
jgi:methionine-gamma-lyase